MKLKIHAATGQGLEIAGGGAQDQAHENHRGKRHPDPDARRLLFGSKAQAGAFDSLFYTVQAAEILAGATNIILLALNMRDGLSIRRRRKPATK